MSVIRSLIPWCLAVLLVLTGMELAVARGQAGGGRQAGGGQAGGGGLAGVMVICSADGPVTVTLDASGNPTGHVRVCPDLASTLFAEGAIGRVQLAPAPLTLRRIVVTARRVAAGPVQSARAVARGPPVPV